jgi:hypothetical protein
LPSSSEKAWVKSLFKKKDQKTNSGIFSLIRDGKKGSLTECGHDRCNPNGKERVCKENEDKPDARACPHELLHQTQ